MYVCALCTCICICAYVIIYVCLYIHVCMYIYKWVGMCIYVHMCALFLLHCKYLSWSVKFDRIYNNYSLFSLHFNFHIALILDRSIYQFRI